MCSGDSVATNSRSSSTTFGTKSRRNAIAFRIQDAFSAAFLIGGREVFTSTSIGIAFSDFRYDSPEEIMRDADTAMYHAKARGKARHEVFDAHMHAQAIDRIGLESDLRRAVRCNDFEVHYQPIVSLNSGACVGFEALLRWTRDGKAVPPATFIPMAEELGLIESIGGHGCCGRRAEHSRGGSGDSRRADSIASPSTCPRDSSRSRGSSAWWKRR